MDPFLFDMCTSKDIKLTRITANVECHKIMKNEHNGFSVLIYSCFGMYTPRPLDFYVLFFFSSFEQHLMVQIFINHFDKVFCCASFLSFCFCFLQLRSFVRALGLSLRMKLYCSYIHQIYYLFGIV